MNDLATQVWQAILPVLATAHGCTTIASAAYVDALKLSSSKRENKTTKKLQCYDGTTWKDAW